MTGPLDRQLPNHTAIKTAAAPNMKVTGMHALNMHTVRDLRLVGRDSTLSTAAHAHKERELG